MRTEDHPFAEAAGRDSPMEILQGSGLRLPGRAFPTPDITARNTIL